MKKLTVYQDEAGDWIVSCEEIPGFTARGRTQQEAVEKMKQAFSVYFPCGGDNCRES
ncbi:MAG: type II toxin-antitoxin system HicB family antitoxin [Nitrospirae bacterium]|nr:type II toxin-antitoxin system HicB family antitoxin [Nitrospirota bacterium]